MSIRERKEQVGLVGLIGSSSTIAAQRIIQLSFFGAYCDTRYRPSEQDGSSDRLSGWFLSGSKHPPDCISLSPISRGGTEYRRTGGALWYTRSSTNPVRQVAVSARGQETCDETFSALGSSPRKASVGVKRMACAAVYSTRSLRWMRASSLSRRV